MQIASYVKPVIQQSSSKAVLSTKELFKLKKKKVISLMQALYFKETQIT